MDFSSLTSTFTRTLSPTGATVLYCRHSQSSAASSADELTKNRTVGLRYCHSWERTTHEAQKLP